MSREDARLLVSHEDPPLLDANRVMRRRAIVQSLLRHRPAPLEQWSAIVHDDSEGLRVQIGLRSVLVERLHEFSTGSASHLSDKLREIIDDIGRAPDLVPVFVVGDVCALLETFDAKSAAAEAQGETNR